MNFTSDEADSRSAPYPALAAGWLGTAQLSHAAQMRQILAA
jgi:hypothetical protein